MNKPKKKRKWGSDVAAVIIVTVIIVSFMVIRARNASNNTPAIQTAVVERGTVTASVSANGVLQPVTTVEVKSNVGGQVVELAVDEGDVVKAGQLIAKIDPSDTISALQQSVADMDSATAKVQQAKQGLSMQNLQTAANVDASEQALEASRQRLTQAEKQALIQPRLTSEAIKQGESNLAAAEAALRQTKNALIPQKLAAAKSSYEQAKASYEKSNNDVTRKRSLLEKGFVSKSVLDASEEQFSVAKAQLESAKSKIDTVQDESDQDLQSALAKVAQATSALEIAKANRVQDELKQVDFAAARAAVKQAQANLASARASAYQIQMKEEDIVQARAGLARSNATLKNAQTQMKYTTIVAPRSGVVVKKYVESGSIVSAGRSSFSGSGSGVGIVDIADITHMMALVNVDETDIAQIAIGQDVDVTVDAYPGKRFKGKVTKIAPQAISDQNVTTIPVTVEIAQPGKELKPAMNATCEFISSRKNNVLLVPSEAVQETQNGMTVTVVVGDKQIVRPVKTGIVGEANTEIISGLNEGDTVVTSVIEPNVTQGPGGPGGGSSSSSSSSRGGSRQMRGGPMGMPH
ncbi:MAG: efflux RND transporter periplasmic adaptor subunit [Armatimonadetes bacterium]|nr:efflux RND transporter periplasmic adaptor subunit [Armatimonadota bacterium]